MARRETLAMPLAAVAHIAGATVWAAPPVIVLRTFEPVRRWTAAEPEAGLVHEGMITVLHLVLTALFAAIAARWQPPGPTDPRATSVSSIPMHRLAGAAGGSLVLSCGLYAWGVLPTEDRLLAVSVVITAYPLAVALVGSLRQRELPGCSRRHSGMRLGSHRVAAVVALVVGATVHGFYYPLTSLLALVMLVLAPPHHYRASGGNSVAVGWIGLALMADRFGSLAAISMELLPEGTSAGSGGEAALYLSSIRIVDRAVLQVGASFCAVLCAMNGLRVARHRIRTR